MHSIFRMISTYNFFSSLRPLVRNLKLITFTYMFTIFCVLTQVLDRSLVNSYGFHAHNSNIGYAVSYIKPKLISKVDLKINNLFPFYYNSTKQSNYSYSFKRSRKKRETKVENSLNKTRARYNTKIVLKAFDKSFSLELNPIQNSDFLSPNLNFFIKNKTYSLNDSIRKRNSDCFYVGKVNNDQQSAANINLCQQGQIFGSFRVDGMDYFIEPDEEFLSLGFNSFLSNQNIKNTEFSFVYIDHRIVTLQTHIIYKKAFDSLETAAKKSCALLGLDEYENRIITKKKTVRQDEQLDKRKENEINRSRRSPEQYSYVIDQMIYLELMVVVDQSMEEYYGTNLENHILTLLFLTTQMYQHPSIINPVRVYTTNIIYLSQLNNKDIDNFEIIWDAEKTLGDFCNWQRDFSESRGLPVADAAILITKKDICKSKDVCQTLGMAKLGQICVPRQNCALIEDSGINTAYTIAHEIGHLLGMKHVDENRCNEFDSLSTQMMASVLDLTKTDYEWSNCSVKELNDFLRQETARCMFNLPENSKNNLNFLEPLEQFTDEIKLKSIFPGDLQTYTLKHQCQQIFGPESDSCEQNLESDCKVLWCKADNSYNLDDEIIQCVTTNTKWADGTPCGLDELNYKFRAPKLCMNGECVLKNSYEAKIVDGSWSSWGEFSECSRSCGGGVRKRFRSCDNPKPKNGGKYCIGDRVYYESCKTQSCPIGPDFRDLQCEIAAIKSSEQNSLKLAGFEGINPKSWKAFHSQDTRRKCTLFCKPDERSNFAVLSPQVIDGTKCSPDSFDICVNGFCLPSGCDNILNSTKKNDNCGICDGDNSTCEEIRYQMEAPAAYGYNDLIDVPAYSTSIKIERQRSGDDLGCLALRTNKVFILNGNYVISKTTTSEVFEGIRIDYIIDETKEIIKSPGNFSQPIRVQFLSGSINQRNNGIINYVYFIPKTNYHNKGTSSRQRIRILAHQLNKDNRNLNNNDLKSNLLYTQKKLNDENHHQSKWVYHEGTKTEGAPCNRMCNGIQRYRIYPVCMNNQNRVDEHMCLNEKVKPKYIEKPCNIDCRLHIFSSSGRCVPYQGKKCGQGVEMPILRCIKQDLSENHRSRLGFEVDLSNCDQNEIKRANFTNKRPCEILCEHFKWKAYDSECSVSCGDGHKLRSYECYDLKKNLLVDSDYCNDLPRPNSEYLRCNFSCYNWQVSSWSQCSKSCGTGYRTRDLYCVYNLQSIVDKSFCDLSSDVPVLRESCNTEDCPAWKLSEWSECSCETSQKVRSVSCYFKDKEIEPMKCKALSAMPTQVEDCVKINCPVWNYTSWSNCSSNCGKGFQTRVVYCTIEETSLSELKPENVVTKQSISINKIAEEKCNHLKKPSNITECEGLIKCSEWRVSEWTSCSVTCGQGFKMRSVQCSTNNAFDCSHLVKPSNSEICIMPYCSSQWHVGNWSECYDGCGFGWRSRSVSCMDKNFNIVQHHFCSNQEKPTNRQRCSSCGSWKIGSWSSCSVSCGQGIRSRNVECFSNDYKSEMPDSNCDIKSKPETTQVCTKDCPEITDEWKITSVAECSVSCGIGWRLRNVMCLRNGKPSNSCKHEQKPEYYEQCDAGECPKWESGSWSECSTSCGDGYKRRLIACRYSNGTVLDDSKCRSREKPDFNLKCSEKKCSIGSWTVGNWSKCDLKSCTMYRQVKCSFLNGSQAFDDHCNKNDRPTHIYQCINRKDCIKYQKYSVASLKNTKFSGIFIYTNWSKCSVKCGLGFRVREPFCVLNTDKSIQLPISYCDQNIMEKININCHLTNCSYKLVKKWSLCSTQCGKRGVEVLEQRCYESITKKYYNLTYCGLNTIENKTRSCYKPCIRHLNHVSFEWKAGLWSNCTGGCGFGQRTRDVFCWNIEEKKKANENNCYSRKKLNSILPCMNTNCQYGWFVSKWSPCSLNCSQGIKKREVKCIKLTKEGYIKNETSDSCDPFQKPKSQIKCNYGNCDSNYFWRPSAWSVCTPNCGFGNQRRSVECVDKDGIIQENQNKCLQEFIPVSHQICFTNCYASTCLQLKNNFGISHDGDYTLNVTNKLVKIYCHNMSSPRPEEFITLSSGQSQNLAEIYDKMLIDPTKCRYGPRYGAYCSFCSNQTVKDHGITLFSRIRINLTNLTIICNDYRFATNQFGSFVPFGSAGDCYSSLPECQHGRININLRGTHFVLDNLVKWLNKGDNSFNRITVSKDRSIVYGTCGGNCGFCYPDPKIGLKLSVI